MFPDPKRHYAYPIERIELEVVMRMSAVKRWHMIDTTRTQTLAEHTCNVMMLAYVIARNAPGMYFGPSYAPVMAAMMHDAPEVFLGDIPTISKQWHDSDRLRETEVAVTPTGFLQPVAVQIKLLVKLCDLADAIRFIRLHGIDMTAKHAQDGLEKQLANKITQMAEDGWPDEVRAMVLEYITFYAYEARESIT
jgi:5'-deoxynucleotidase